MSKGLLSRLGAVSVRKRILGGLAVVPLLSIAVVAGMPLGTCGA